MRSRLLKVAVSKATIPICLATAWVVTFVTTANASFTDKQKLLVTQQQVQEVVSHLDGAMDTSAQALAKSNAPSVRIITYKIRVKDAAKSLNRPSAFLYQEQAMTQRLSKPYRQRFYVLLLVQIKLVRISDF